MSSLPHIVRGHTNLLDFARYMYWIYNFNDPLTVELSVLILGIILRKPKEPTHIPRVVIIYLSLSLLKSLTPECRWTARIQCN